MGVIYSASADPENRTNKEDQTAAAPATTSQPRSFALLISKELYTPICTELNFAVSVSSIMASNTADQQPFRFLNLPAELRCWVYERIHFPTTWHALDAHLDQHTWPRPPNTQVYDSRVTLISPHTPVLRRRHALGRGRTIGQNPGRARESLRSRCIHSITE